MPGPSEPILNLPVQEIAEHSYRDVSPDRTLGRDVAGPLFEAGICDLCLCQRQEYSGDLHRTTKHWFCLVVQGQIEFRLERSIHIVKPGELVCIPAGTTVKRTGLGPIEWLYIVIEDIHPWSRLKTNGPSVRPYESADLMYILMRRIIDSLRSQDIYSVQCAFESSEMLLKLLKRELRQGISEWHSDRMRRLTKLLDRIRKEPEREWSREMMAQEVCMSVRSLTRIFRQTYNTSPMKMVVSLRMDLACQMLISTDMTVGMIARAAGYQSTFSFNRLFRQHVGISPGKYRAGRRAGRIKRANEASET